MVRGVLITARQIIWTYKPIYQANWELVVMWVVDRPVDNIMDIDLYIYTYMMLIQEMY